MKNEKKVISAISKLFNSVLPTIYPMITSVEVVENPPQDKMGGEDYTVVVNTTISNTVDKHNYWEWENWFSDESNNHGVVLDYLWMNDVVIPDLLKYVSLKDIEFSRDVKVYNIDGELIVTA